MSGIDCERVVELVEFSDEERMQHYQFRAVETMFRDITIISRYPNFLKYLNNYSLMIGVTN
ncbi:hypothetical protein J4463_00790 [Candidatus Pacearchaeota archaeon]|nr:hypothetical protein [Candidatus Pacearchaeota archaeon]